MLLILHMHGVVRRKGREGNGLRVGYTVLVISKEGIQSGVMWFSVRYIAFSSLSLVAAVDGEMERGGFEWEQRRWKGKCITGMGIQLIHSSI